MSPKQTSDLSDFSAAQKAKVQISLANLRSLGLETGRLQFHVVFRRAQMC